MVRLVLSGANIYYNNSNNPFGYSGIDVSNMRKKALSYNNGLPKRIFPSEEQNSYHDNNKWGLDFISFVGVLLKQAERRRKSGLTVLSDLGSFHHHHHHHNHGNQKLIE
jgi:hypothetical protein